MNFMKLHCKKILEIDQKSHFTAYKQRVDFVTDKHTEYAFFDYD
ncbi:hypothetical protein VCHA50O409_40162 [Vibrio chagasii]|nr:hypothetical protein VCHA40P240_10585 [Vibrio chagasii]CAH7215142.1 hypothetical protein VCHA50O409_40162 [Vibrio chagasii]CAH7435122.1 hypothetical protein VCHA53O473_80093 [Vibrio chagasii]